MTPLPSRSVPIYKGLSACPYCGVEVDEDMVERGRQAVNEAVDGLTLKKASEGHPWAEEAIARAVLRYALDERNRP